MARLTPQQAGDKWKRRLQQSTTDITSGVNAVTENPAQKAIQKKDKMRQNWLASVDNGKWEAGLSRVTLSDWKNAMINKGIPRISAGAEAGMGNYIAYQQEVQPYMEQLQAEIDSMPDLTIEDSVNRMVTWMRGMANFQRT